MPRKAVTSARVTPTGTLRGTHSEAGRPIRVRAIGVAMSRPARSPIHQVAQAKVSPEVGISPTSRNARLATVAETTLLAVQGGDEAGDVAGQRQRERLRHEAPDQPRADMRLQRCTACEGERGDQGPHLRVAAPDQQRTHQCEGRRGDGDEHAPAVDQHARQRDAGGGEERRCVAGRQRQEACRRADPEIGEGGEQHRHPPAPCRIGPRVVDGREGRRHGRAQPDRPQAGDAKALAACRAGRGL